MKGCTWLTVMLIEAVCDRIPYTLIDRSQCVLAEYCTHHCITFIDMFVHSWSHCFSRRMIHMYLTVRLIQEKARLIRWSDFFFYIDIRSETWIPTEDVFSNRHWLVWVLWLICSYTAPYVRRINILCVMMHSFHHLNWSNLQFVSYCWLVLVRNTTIHLLLQ